MVQAAKSSAEYFSLGGFNVTRLKTSTDVQQEWTSVWFSFSVVILELLYLSMTWRSKGPNYSSSCVLVTAPTARSQFLVSSLP